MLQFACIIIYDLLLPANGPGLPEEARVVFSKDW